MNNFDQITRRDFLSRVTTLAGGVVVATSAGLLAGCGSDNGSSSTTQPKSFPSQPAAPAALTPQQALSLAIGQGWLPANSTITATTPITTLTASNANASAVAGLIAANLPTPGVVIFPTLTSFTTGQALQLTSAQIAAGIQTYLSEAGIAFSAGDVVELLTYSINGQSYNSIAVVAPNGTILFDTYASLLPPTSSTATLQTQASNDYSANSVGQARYTAYNPADGHLLVDIGFTATPHYDVNGNLSATNPVTVAQASGTGNAGPGIQLASKTGAIKLQNSALKTAKVSSTITRDTITNTTLVVSITVGGLTTTVILSVTIDVGTGTTTTTIVAAVIETFAGIVLWELVVVVVLTTHNTTGA